MIVSVRRGPDSGHIDIVLHLDVGRPSDPLSGVVRVEGAPDTAVRGWLELMAVIDAARLRAAPTSPDDEGGTS